VLIALHRDILLEAQKPSRKAKTMLINGPMAAGPAADAELMAPIGDWGSKCGRGYGNGSEGAHKLPFYD